MIAISAKARSSEVRQVWENVAQKVDEIFESEEIFLDEQTDDERLYFWRKSQDVIYRRCKKVPFFRVVRDVCYRLLQALVFLSVLVLMGVFVASVFVELHDLVAIAGKATTAMFRLGVCIALVSFAVYRVQRWHENVLTYQLAIQQILANNYGLADDYSSDVNAYAVLMLAASELSFKAARKVREENAQVGKDDEDVYIVGTDEDIEGNE